MGYVTAGISDSVGEVTEGISDSFGEVTEGISDSFGEVTEGISDSIGDITGDLEGTFGDLSGDIGLGSLSDVKSQASAILALDGSLGSVTNLAASFGVVPEWLNTAVSMFNQDTIMPLYISEDNREDWRSGDPFEKMARMSMMQSVPLANTAMGFSDNIANFSCGSVGVWGQKCPLRGFVETSGNNFPASGLAGWRAYHKALPKIPDRKRMKEGKPTVFNLDYPHQSACHEIGADPDVWETRSGGGGGIINQLFGGAASGLSSIFSAGNPDAGLGDMFGKVSDARAESGVFVYSYWKNTK